MKFNFDDLEADILISSTHKHMYGIPGLGFIIHREGIQINPLIFGGNGQRSASMRQSEVMPYIMESGTVNTPAMLALLGGLDFLNENRDAHKHEENLLQYFINKCDNFKA